MVHDEVVVIAEHRGEIWHSAMVRKNGRFFIMVEIVYLFLYGSEHLGMHGSMLRTEHKK